MVDCLLHWLIGRNALKLTKKVVEGDTDYDIVWMSDNLLSAKSFNFHIYLSLY